MITYEYQDTAGIKRKGEIRLQSADEAIEMDVLANGWRFHVIAGKQINGNYICIPNWNIGSELGYLDDEFWNSERLSQYTPLHEDNAVAIARALSVINHWLTENGEEWRG